MGRRRRKAIGRQKARLTLAKNGIQTALHLTPTMKDWQPRPSTSLLSSPTNATLAPMNILRPQTDTVQFTVRRRPVEKKKKKKDEEPEPIEFLGMNVNASGSINLYDTDRKSVV